MNIRTRLHGRLREAVAHTARIVGHRQLAAVGPTSVTFEDFESAEVAHTWHTPLRVAPLVLEGTN